MKLLTGLIGYFVLHLLPIHVLATLDLLRLVDSVSLSNIAFLEALILLTLLVWVRFNHIGARPAEYRDVAWGFDIMSKQVVISTAIVAGCYLVFAVDLLSSYPSGWDGLEYHLSLAVHWLQNGSLRIPLSKVWKYSMPGNAEISMMALLGVGWQALATLFNWVAVVILACASYLIAVKCDASRVAAFICTLILASIPIVNFQAYRAYVDLYGCGFFMAAVALFLYRHDTPNSLTKPNLFLIRIVLSGLACGIAIGTKPTFYIYAVVFFIVVLGTIVVERKRYGKSIVLLAALMFITMLVPSIFWFGRAFFATGNPFYPLKMAILGFSIGDGYSPSQITSITHELNLVRTPVEWLIYPWTEYKGNGYNYSSESGFGASFATFVPLGVFYTLYTDLLNRKQNKNAVKSILTVLLFVGVVIWWFVVHRMPRFR